MPIYHPHNLFRGINPLLNSQLITAGWHSFHTVHITDLMKLLRKGLHPLGYTANIEQSLQIRREYDEIAQPRALGIYTYRQPADALGIYTYRQPADALGELVGWLELLSPSNKPSGQDGSYYTAKRLELLKKGLVFIELDYLHHMPPTFDTIPPYRLWRKGMDDDFVGHPYRIVVMDTRPTLQDGMAKISEFDVDNPIPTLTIPLNRGDSLNFDFDHAYQTTFSEGLYGDMVDYNSLPANINRYSPDDQARILSRLCHIRQHIAYPAPMIPTLPLADAWVRWEQA